MCFSNLFKPNDWKIVFSAESTYEYACIRGGGIFMAVVKYSALRNKYIIECIPNSDTNKDLKAYRDCVKYIQSKQK